MSKNTVSLCVASPGPYERQIGSLVLGISFSGFYTIVKDHPRLHKNPQKQTSAKS